MALKQIRCCSDSRTPLRINSEAGCRALLLSALSSSKRSMPRRLCLCALRCCFKLLNTSDLARCNGGVKKTSRLMFCALKLGLSERCKSNVDISASAKPSKIQNGVGGWGRGGGGGLGVMKEGERGSPHRLQRVPALKMKPTEALNGVLRHRRDPFRRFLSDATPKEGLAKNTKKGITRGHSSRIEKRKRSARHFSFALAFFRPFSSPLSTQCDFCCNH